MNVGIFVAELHGYFIQEPRPRLVAEYYCEIRRRLGEMMPGEGEYWWSLGANPVAVAADVRRALEDYGLPYLESLKSGDLIIRAWYRTGHSIGFSSRGALAIALLHLGARRQGGSRAVGPHIPCKRPRTQAPGLRQGPGRSARSPE